MTQALSSSIAVIGAVQSAFLTELQFQTQFGPGWILADGRDVSLSRYSVLTGRTFAPDLRGAVLRGKDEGAGKNPDGETLLGTYQADALQGHFHSTSETAHHHDSTSGGLSLLYNAGSGGMGALAAGTTIAATAPATGNNVSGVTVTAATTDGSHGVPALAAETRMKNVTVNHFIRIN